MCSSRVSVLSSTAAAAVVVAEREEDCWRAVAKQGQSSPDRLWWRALGAQLGTGGEISRDEMRDNAEQQQAATEGREQHRQRRRWSRGRRSAASGALVLCSFLSLRRRRMQSLSVIQNIRIAHYSHWHEAASRPLLFNRSQVVNHTLFHCQHQPRSTPHRHVRGRNVHGQEYLFFEAQRCTGYADTHPRQRPEMASTRTGRQRSCSAG